MQATIIEYSKKFTKPAGFIPNYGTAGFRAESSLLDSTVFRCGVLMAIRSLQTKQVTGLCITASHNPIADNGVKMVEPNGEMLNQRFETVANGFANAETHADLADMVMNEINSATDGMVHHPESPTVLIAHDTRPSGVRLAAAAAAGVEALGGRPKILGLLTTPQLHWAVMRTNQNLPSTEADYVGEFATAFDKLCAGVTVRRVLHVDCANGVGGVKLPAFLPLLKHSGLDLVLHNLGNGILNHNCGSDYVQKERQIPEEFENVPVGEPCCAIDGDADRLIFFYRTNPETKDIMLLDGDKIAALIAILVCDLITALPKPLSGSSVGVIQTAYANGASSAYLRDVVGCDVKVTPTGVKHLHKAAHAYDTGIYFEANGHGTVIFKTSFLAALQQTAITSSAASELLALNGVVNSAVGDAISGILLVEAALRRKGWDLQRWASLYSDLPSRQLKVRVADRSVIKTTDAERKVAEPLGMQQQIDAIVSKFQDCQGRSFVRPSGTEDVVRVYAEAESQEKADDLASAVALLVHQIAGGIGSPPGL